MRKPKRTTEANEMKKADISREAKSKATYGIEMEQQTGLKDLDPHLQEAVLTHRAGESGDPALSHQNADGTTQIDVIAKLADSNIDVPGLRKVRVMGQIVTGTVNVQEIEQVRQHENVISLKQATRLQKHLRFSVNEIEAQPQQMRGDLNREFNGAGVIVGVVDFGCDFQHRNFLRSDGTTRLLYLWDQTGGPTSLSPVGFGYGREFNSASVNSALQSNDPYMNLRYLPNKGSHGTHVMDIAAGNGRATGNPGVASSADLIFVELNAIDFDDEGSFGNSRRLLEAVDYIFSKASELNRPCVVNLSLGTHGGPHDGSTLVEQGFDALLTADNRAIVMSGGNSRDVGGHASGAITIGTPRVLKWVINNGDSTENELEVWYDGEDELEVTLITPAGGRLGSVALGETVNFTQQGRRVGRIIHRKQDPNNNDNQIDILLDPNLPSGQWQVELKAVREGRPPVNFHAWIERDDAGQSRFVTDDADPTYTIGSISCGTKTIVVGSYDATVPGRDISFFSSEGPTRTNVRKPEISAPGHNIIAANARSQGTTVKSGTSMAAPHVTGAVALLMQAANRTLNVDEVRDAIINSARDNPPTAEGGDGVYGQGRISVLAALRALGVETMQPGTAIVIDGDAQIDVKTAKEMEMTQTNNGGLPRKVRVMVEVDIDPSPQPVEQNLQVGAALQSHRAVALRQAKVVALGLESATATARLTDDLEALYIATRTVVDVSDNAGGPNKEKIERFLNAFESTDPTIFIQARNLSFSIINIPLRVFTLKNSGAATNLRQFIFDSLLDTLRAGGYDVSRLTAAPSWNDGTTLFEIADFLDNNVP